MHQAEKAQCKPSYRTLHMCTRTHTCRYIHTFILHVHKIPKQASQPGSWLQPLPICVLQIGIWIKWNLRCPEGGKRRQSLTWPDLLPEQTFKMRINFRWGKQKNPLPLFSQTRRISKQRVKTGTCKCVHIHKHTHTRTKPEHASVQSAILMCESESE